MAASGSWYVKGPYDYENVKNLWNLRLGSLMERKELETRCMLYDCKSLRHSVHRGIHLQTSMYEWIAAVI